MGQLGYASIKEVGESGGVEESGRVDDEGRPILECADLIEAFFTGIHSDINHVFYVVGIFRVDVSSSFLLGLGGPRHHRYILHVSNE